MESSRIDIEIHVLDPKPYWFDSHSRHRSVGRSHGQYIVEHVDSTVEYCSATVVISCIVL